MLLLAECLALLILLVPFSLSNGEFPVSVPIRLTVSKLARSDVNFSGRTVNAGRGWLQIGPSIIGGPCDVYSEECKPNRNASNMTGMVINPDSTVKLYTTLNVTNQQIIYADQDGSLKFTAVTAKGQAVFGFNVSRPFPNLVPLGLQGPVSELSTDQTGDAVLTSQPMRMRPQYFACLNQDIADSIFYALYIKWTPAMALPADCIRITLGWIPYGGNRPASFV